jgi:hypothetical protein
MHLTVTKGLCQLFGYSQRRYALSMRDEAMAKEALETLQAEAARTQRIIEGMRLGIVLSEATHVARCMVSSVQTEVYRDMVRAAHKVRASH